MGRGRAGQILLSSPTKDQELSQLAALSHLQAAFQPQLHRHSLLSVTFLDHFTRPLKTLGTTVGTQRPLALETRL